MPKTHNLAHLSDGEIYDLTQTSDDIKDGDVLILSGGRTALLMGAWPTMVVGASDALHRLMPGRTWGNIECGRYAFAAEIARSAA